MTSRIPLLAVVLLFALVSVAWISAPAPQEAIAGTWIVTSEDNSHQRGLFLFTADGSYSAMFVRGDEPRAEPSQDWTDADALASFREITANSGRLTVEGNEITMEAYMANNTAYMNGWPENDQTATFEMNDNRMTLTMGNGQVFTLRKPQ